MKMTDEQFSQLCEIFFVYDEEPKGALEDFMNREAIARGYKSRRHSAEPKMGLIQGQHWLPCWL